MVDSEKNYKYSEWCLTIKSSVSNPLLGEHKVLSALRLLSESYTFQRELSTTNLPHYQCCFKTKIRKMFSTLLNDLERELSYPRALLELDRSYDYKKSIEYCSDKGKRAPDSSIFSSEPISSYEGADIAFLDDKSNRYPWQVTFMETFFNEDETNIKTPDDRTVYWIQDPRGNSGKSKFCKWLVRNYSYITKIAFGTSTQLRSAVISEGPKRFYILDVPRTLGSDDSMSTVISVIEDIKNGYVKSGMYGQSKEIFLDPPHIVVLTNRDCPQNLLSEDRWVITSILCSKQLHYFSKHIIQQNML